MVHANDYDEEEGNFWRSVNKLSRNPDRPKRNSTFLLFLVLVGVVGVVVFSILAVTTKDGRERNCPCANPYRILGNGERLLDQTQCEKDQTYMACYTAATKRFTLYAGLAGGSGGLLVLAALLFRYG